MSRDRVLPPILTIKQIENELGIGRNFKTETIHHELCTYINNHDFQIYLKSNDFDLYNLSDSEKNNKLTLKSKAKPINLIDTELVIQEIYFQKYPVKIFDPAYSNLSKQSYKEFTINRVLHKSNEYFISLKGNHDIGVQIHIEDLFGKRDEIFSFKLKNLNSEISAESQTTSKTKKINILDERIEAFKYWLISNSGKSIHQNNDLQQCYESKGSPTRDEIWNRLQKMDNKLFSSGYDDFIKEIGKVINLKKGTGKSRD